MQIAYLPIPQHHGTTVLVRVKVEATNRRISDYLAWPKYDSHMNEPIEDSNLERSFIELGRQGVFTNEMAFSKDTTQ